MRVYVVISGDPIVDRDNNPKVSDKGIALGGGFTIGVIKGIFSSEEKAKTYIKTLEILGVDTPFYIYDYEVDDLLYKLNKIKNILM